MRAVTAFAFSVFALGATMSAARADVYGPHSDIRAIRAAVPVLVAAFVRSAGGAPADIRVDDIVVDGDEAIADWREAHSSGLIGLARRYGTWWVSGKIVRDANAPTGSVYWYLFPQPGSLFEGCVGSAAFQAAPIELPVTLHVDDAIAMLAAAHIPAIATDAAAQRLWRSAHPQSLTVPGTVPECYNPYPARSLLDFGGGYRAYMTWSAPPSLTISRFTGRAPTAAEFPPSPGANSVYFFSFEIGATTPATVNNGSLDVWCPFVLDPERRYSLTIDYVTPAVGPVYGTLFDNTLRFALPAFTIAPNTSAMGEIDFLPPRS